MKFTRRAEGIKTARSVFKKAREDIRSRYHVFVAAALMEYYCSKDKDVAFRIFELGLKRFGGSPEYVMCYIDYLSHLNEDNNTRVLFERVLSSGGLTNQLSVEVWNKFLEFESNIGDLSSIVKVERRRSAVLEKLKEYEGKETAQLIDRYKFLDLFPCSSSELRSIGYHEISAIASGSKAQQHIQDDGDESQKILPRPNFSHMIPFKPKAKAYRGEHPMGGGVFPQPPALAALCAILPPPTCFRGPFVAVDKLIDVFNKIKIDGKNRVENLFLETKTLYFQPQFQLPITEWTQNYSILRNPFIGSWMTAAIQTTAVLKGEDCFLVLLMIQMKIQQRLLPRTIFIVCVSKKDLTNKFFAR